LQYFSEIIHENGAILLVISVERKKTIASPGDRSGRNSPKFAPEEGTRPHGAFAEKSPRSSRPRGESVFRLSLTTLLLTQFATGLGAQHTEEYRIKAAFLYNFAKFVDWPKEAFRGPGDPITVCVLGRDPFGQVLDDAVAGKAIGGRPLVARRIAAARQTAGCHILFVSSSEAAHDLSIIAAVKQPGILTIGEAGSATSEGLIINLTREGGKVRFQINMAEAKAEKLRLSSRLLSLATK
jgi:hypothetical protein